MLEVKITADTPQELIEQILNLSLGFIVMPERDNIGLAAKSVSECPPKTPPCCGHDACVEEPAQDVQEPSALDGVEYVDMGPEDVVVEAKPKAKTKRKKKTEEAAVEEVVKEAAAPPKEVVDQVREVLVKAKDAAGLDAVRVLLSGYGGTLPKCPPERLGDLLAAANALLAESAA